MSSTATPPLIHTRLSPAELKEARDSGRAFVFSLPVDNGKYETAHVHLLPGKLNKRGHQKIEICLTEHLGEIVVVCSDWEKRDDWVRKFRPTSFLVASHGFPYLPMVMPLEYCPPSPALSSSPWAIVCSPQNGRDDLKKSLENFYKTVGYVHPHTIQQTNPQVLAASPAAITPIPEPPSEEMDVDEDLVQYPPPHQVTLSRPNLKDHRTGFLMVLSPRLDGNCGNVLDGYEPHRCYHCRVLKDDYEFEHIEEWRNVCPECPAYDKRADDPNPDTRRCVACILGMRTRRLDLGFETHPRDAFPTPLEWEVHHKVPTLSAFIFDAIELIGYDIFVVASTVTMVALLKEYVTFQLGKVDSNECTETLYRVEEGFNFGAFKLFSQELEELLLGGLVHTTTQDEEKMKMEAVTKKFGEVLNLDGTVHQ